MMKNIQNKIQNANAFDIKPKILCHESYASCTEMAKEKYEKPKLEKYPDSIDQYDSIFASYPIWWDIAPMNIGTF